MRAEVKILIEGHVTTNRDIRVGEAITWPTVTLVKDEDIIIVVDPGTLESQQILIDKLKEEGLGIDDINIVCVTHSHINHYRNVGMFPEAKVLEHFGLWNKTAVKDWKEQFSENIKIFKTPGHDYSSIMLLVLTEIGKVAICGDVFWQENYPENDVSAHNQEKLRESRRLVLKMSDWIIPGHGPMFKSKHFLYERLQEEPKKVILGSCKKCHRLFVKEENKCQCQPFLCYYCCECEYDCDICNCKRKRARR